MQPIRDARGALAGLLFLTILATASPAAGQEAKDANPPAPLQATEPWYERIKIRGYTQFRYNRIGADNPHLKNSQGDKSIGDSGGFYIRRARVILYGDPAPFLAFYFQPDFASAIQEQLNVGIMRDWYGDIFLDGRKEFRIRVGQSKVPYGWELMQSSQNRLPFDRTDALNSAFVNERDIGAHFMFAPETIRKRFRHLVESGLKGSGDYGMVSVGLINGQPLNTPEKNDNKHFVGRVAVPFEVGSQTVEMAAGGYTGRFVPTKADDTIKSAKDIRDFRFHSTFVLYPQPFGLQAEYNWGKGPELLGKTIFERPLEGGYVMAMYRTKTESYGTFTPYVRLHRYDGGKKFETNAPRHEVRELNAGLEWQLKQWLEITGEWMESERAVNTKREVGRLFRLQVQLNY